MIDQRNTIDNAGILLPVRGVGRKHLPLLSEKRGWMLCLTFLDLFEHVNVRSAYHSGRFHRLF
jgi:hypothetical protein